MHTTQYLVEDDVNPTGLPQVVEELTGPIGAGVVSRTYTYGLQRISQNLSPTISGNSTWTPSFYGYDGFGTVRQLTDINGTVTDSYEYDAFGNSFTKTGSTPNNYLYRGEQYDSDLGLYYLRARYYNPATGRFLSRDPEDGHAQLPMTLHKYLYAGGEPVNHADPRGREAMFDYAIRSNAAIPESKVISIYGCIAGAALTAVDLVLGEFNDTTGNISTTLGVGSSVIGCVVLMPGLNELAEAGAKVTKTALEFVGNAAAFGSCALDAEHFVNALNDLATGKPAGDEIGESIESLGSCVGTELGYMETHPATALQGLGLE